MRFTRPFWMVAVGVIGLLSAASAAQAQHTRLLPNDTEMVFSINLQQILKSDVVTKNEFLFGFVKGKIEETLKDKGITKFLEKADFDLFRDLHSITMSVPGGNRDGLKLGDKKISPQDGFIVITGNFDAEKIAAVAKDLDKEFGGVKPIKIAHVNAFEIAPKEEKKMYIGILDKSTAIASATKEDFVEAANRHAANKKAAFKSESMRNLLETVNTKQSLSIVATSNIFAKLAENLPEGAQGDKLDKAMDILKQSNGFSAAITIEKDIDFLFGVDAKDKEAAKKLTGEIEGGIAAIKAFVAIQKKRNQDVGPLEDIVNTLKLTTTGNNLVVRGQVSFDLLSEILKSLPIPKD